MIPIEGRTLVRVRITPNDITDYGMSSPDAMKHDLIRACWERGIDTGEEIRFHETERGEIIVEGSSKLSPEIDALARFDGCKIEHAHELGICGYVTHESVALFAGGSRAPEPKLKAEPLKVLFPMALIQRRPSASPIDSFGSKEVRDAAPALREAERIAEFKTRKRIVRARTQLVRPDDPAFQKVIQGEFPLRKKT